MILLCTLLNGSCLTFNDPAWSLTIYRDLYGIVCFCLILCGFVWSLADLDGTIWMCMDLQSILQSCIVYRLVLSIMFVPCWLVLSCIVGWVVGRVGWQCLMCLASDRSQPKKT